MLVLKYLKIKLQKYKQSKAKQKLKLKTMLPTRSIKCRENIKRSKWKKKRYRTTSICNNCMQSLKADDC